MNKIALALAVSTVAISLACVMGYSLLAPQAENIGETQPILLSAKSTEAGAVASPIVYTKSEQDPEPATIALGAAETAEVPAAESSSAAKPIKVVLTVLATLGLLYLAAMSIKLRSVMLGFVAGVMTVIFVLGMAFSGIRFAVYAIRDAFAGLKHRKQKEVIFTAASIH